MKYNYKQKFLEDWQIDWWIKKNKALLWFALIFFIAGLVVSGFGNPIP